LQGSVTYPGSPLSRRFRGDDEKLIRPGRIAPGGAIVKFHNGVAGRWDEGCKSCSFWADNFNGIPIHLNHRDVTFTAVSRAPLAKIDAYKQRMGWSFP